ncbi:class F sortase [Streptomyces flaveus]|uniref:Class F sortase n=1 Tax=Streptomyces flaveus TaxID=66370 RepID=A0A917QD94_9ACTN|nr:class F sortase [Streptomyces flaveus]GGK44611.1 class F sortase [Streptomyces flaveus]
MHRFSNAAIAAVTVVAFGSGAWLVRSGAEAHAPPQPSAAQSRADAHADRPAATPLPPSLPDRVRIPSIRVDAPLTGLGLTPQGGLDVPPASRRNLAGWYAGGATPGERGTAIVVGHVDNADGPAVFFRLGALEKADTIEISRRDGTVAVFSVDAVEVYDAHDFPDEKVYGASHEAELRVITCGGGYSEATGYRGNVVVFAHLASGG